MAQPITWHNVNGVDLSTAMNGIGAAQRSIGGAFSGLQDVIKQREATDAANMVQTVKNNTNSYLDQVAQLGSTPAALKQAIDTGALEKLRSSFGPAIDQAATRGAAENLLAKRYEQVTAADKFADTQLTKAERPIHNSILTKAFSGDMKGAMDLAAQNPNLLSSPELQRTLSEYQQTLKKQGQEDTRFTWDKERQKWAGEKAAKDLQVADANIANQRAQANNAATMTKATIENMATNREDRVTARLDRQLENAQGKLAKNMGANNVYSSGTSDSQEGVKAISEYINTTFKDPTQADSLRSAVAKLQGEKYVLRDEQGKAVVDKETGKPMTVAVPTSVMLDAINNTTSNWHTFSSNRGNTMKKYIEDRMLLDPKIMVDATQAMTANQGALQDYARAREASIASRNSKVSENVGGDTRKKVLGAEVASPNLANSVVGTPAASKPVAVPSVVDGAAATATHFSLKPGSSSKAAPIAPIAVDPNTKWKAPVPVVESKSTSGQKAVVTYVSDGDSATLQTTNGGSINCRIDTIDAPETAKPSYNKPGQPYGEKAKETLQKLIENKEVNVIVTRAADGGPKTGANNYGRSLCKIEVEGANVDAKMVQAGAAWLYRKYGSSDAVEPSLEPALKKAKENRTGLWADPNPEDPKDFRRRTK